MTVRVSTEKELGEALKHKADTIEIVGNLANKTIKLRATGTVAWAIAFAAIGLAVYGAISVPVTAGVGGLVAGVSATAALGILGSSVTCSAVAIGIAAGSAGILTSLRNYKEISRTSDSLILKRK
jgi:hypothetical protein